MKGELLRKEKMPSHNNEGTGKGPTITPPESL